MKHGADHRVIQRIRELGAVGEALSRHLDPGATFIEGTMVGAKKVSSLDKAGHYLRAAATSMLCCGCPIQVATPRSHIIQFVREVVSRSPPVIRALKTDFNLRGLSNHDIARLFPLKSHPGATNKVNVYLNEIMDAAEKYYRHAYYLFKSHATTLVQAGVYNDQASAILLYTCVCESELGDAAFVCALLGVLDGTTAKALSTVVKSLGWNASAAGCHIAELNTLQGRATGDIDLYEESLYRCDPVRCKEKIASVNPDTLRRVVAKIVDEELRGRDVEYDTLADHWDRRWEWCVNGSHSKIMERIRPEFSVEKIPGYNRYYRRMFAEALYDEPISRWDGTVAVSASRKLEHGKTRAIFACDTISYFAFEHMLRPIEKAWQGRRVVLDPGANGISGICNRVLRSHERAPFSLMLDYDDFNSQHSNSAMKIVIEELGNYTNYPRDLLEKLVGSFDHAQMFYQGRKVGDVVGTLMSGHRATTIINSILNAAYIRMFAGEELYSRFWALHVGDDVFMAASSLSDATELIDRVVAGGCRLNPLKQSLGEYVSEFLRVAITPREARGYIARSISSTISGNWINEYKLDPMEGLRTMLTCARTMINRSGDKYCFRLLTPSCARMACLPMRIVAGLLGGYVALGDSGVVYGARATLRRVDIAPVSHRQPDFDSRQVPAHATTAYLTRAISDVERFALMESETSVRSAMLRASYKQGGVASSGPDYLKVQKQKPSRLVNGSIEVRKLLSRRALEGVLTKYPVLMLIRNQIDVDLLRELVRYVGGEYLRTNIELEAWGGQSHNIVVDGVLPYNDAVALAPRTTCDVVTVLFPIRV